MERVKCRYCGEGKSKGGIWTHEHKACPKRPTAGTVSASPRARARRSRSATKFAPPAPHTSNGNGLATGWPFTAPAAEQDLFAQLVRDGLSLREAQARVEQARAVFRG